MCGWNLLEPSIHESLLSLALVNAVVAAHRRKELCLAMCMDMCIDMRIGAQPCVWICV